MRIFPTKDVIQITTVFIPPLMCLWAVPTDACVCGPLMWGRCYSCAESVNLNATCTCQTDVAVCKCKPGQLEAGKGDKQTICDSGWFVPVPQYPNTWKCLADFTVHCSETRCCNADSQGHLECSYDPYDCQPVTSDCAWRNCGDSYEYPYEGTGLNCDGY